MKTKFDRALRKSLSAINVKYKGVWGLKYWYLRGGQRFVDTFKFLVRLGLRVPAVIGILRRFLQICCPCVQKNVSGIPGAALAARGGLCL
jgi:hypothetical protein